MLRPFYVLLHLLRESFQACRDAQIRFLQLLDWAIDPTTLFNEGSVSRPARKRQSPGEDCPLCGFPTHDWFEFPADDSHSVVDAIRVSHPAWRPESGACRQCAEMYTSVKPKAGYSN